MTVDEFDRKYQNMTADEIISQLEKEYENDSEALTVIERAKKNIEYIKKQKEYKGQTPKQCALSVAGELLYWH